MDNATTERRPAYAVAAEIIQLYTTLGVGWRDGSYFSLREPRRDDAPTVYSHACAAGICRIASAVAQPGKFSKYDPAGELNLFGLTVTAAHGLIDGNDGNVREVDEWRQYIEEGSDDPSYRYEDYEYGAAIGTLVRNHFKKETPE